MVLPEMSASVWKEVEAPAVGQLRGLQHRIRMRTIPLVWRELGGKLYSGIVMSAMSLRSKDIA